MAIKPITGLLRRQVSRDIAVGLTLGFGTAIFWWYTFRMPTADKRKQFFLTLEEEKRKNAATE